LTGKESGHQENVARPPSAGADPDALEVVPGTQRDQLEGWVPGLASAADLQAALDRAFDYRGDVQITRKDGSRIEGYVYDRRPGPTLKDSLVRVLPTDGSGRISIPYSEIAALAFTGRDMAAGRSWEAWVRQYWEKKAAGEKNISLESEKLD
jgi:hypothetical protein